SPTCLIPKSSSLGIPLGSEAGNLARHRECFLGTEYEYRIFTFRRSNPEPLLFLSEESFVFWCLIRALVVRKSF
ncbi:MAG: hypothetical protein WBW56_00315, partial [Syntrophobacteraceae bacterium]